MCEGPQCNEIVLMSSVGKSRPCKRLGWDDLPATSSTQFHLITSAIKAGLDTPFCLVFLVNFFQPYLVKTTTRPPTQARTQTHTHTHTSCGENKRHNGISINDYLQLSLYLYIHIHIYRYWRFPFFDGIFHHKSTVFGEFGVPPINKSYLFQRKLQRQAIALWSWSAPKTRPWFRRTSTVTMRRPGGPGNPGFTRPGKTKSTIEAMAPVEIVDLPS